MKRNEMDENETVNWNAYEYDFMRFELEEQKIILGFDTGSGTYPSIHPSQARTTAQSSPITRLLPPNFTLTPVKAQAGIPNT